MYFGTMSKSDDLHRLIRSFSPSEKRYIKVMAGQGSNYTQCIPLLATFHAQASVDVQLHRGQRRAHTGKTIFSGTARFIAK